MSLGHGASIVRDGLVLHLDAANVKSYPGTGTSITDITANGYNHTLFNEASTSIVDGVVCWNCTTNEYIRDAGQTFQIASEHTYMAWARLKSGNSTWRTLWRTQPDDHPLLIESRGSAIGWYDNSAGGFRSFGLDVVTLGLENTWALYTVVGSGTSCTCYINDGAVNGTSTAGNTAGQFQDTIGSVNSSSQPFGHISTATIYNRALTAPEIKQNFEAARSRYGI